MGLLALFSREGDILLAAVAASAFVVAGIAGAIRFRAIAQLAMVLAGPVAAVIAYRVINPDPGCTQDCVGKGAWAVFLGLSTVAWWSGLVVGGLVRNEAERRSERSEAGHEGSR
jgi:hypothetical protein